MFQPILLHPLHITYFLVYRETAPFSSTSNNVIDKDQYAQPGYWRYRVGANHGGSGGRDARCKDSHMPAELPRQTAPIHHFQTHAAQRAQRLFICASLGASDLIWLPIEYL